MSRKKRASRSGHCRKRNRALSDHPKKNASTIATAREYAGQPPHSDRPRITVAAEARKATNQERYEQLRDAYGPLKAYAFVHELKDGHGNADWLACAVLEWILDWQRPDKGGGARYDGRLWFYSASLADGTFGVSNDRLKRARMRLKAAGLVTFHQSGRRTWVEVHWDAIEHALASNDHKRRISPPNLKACVYAPPDQDGRGDTAPAQAKTRCKGAPASPARGAMTPGLPPYDPSASKGTSLRTEEEGISTKARSLRGDRVASEARKLIERGRKRGRVCTGKWERMSVDAFVYFVSLGCDPNAIGRAWDRYLDGCSEGRSDSSNASTLGHWMKGLSLKGEPRDYGSQSFEALYQQALAAIEREAEAEAIKSGRMPRHPEFRRVMNDDRCPWLVCYDGKNYVPYDAVGPDATLDDCYAAFPEWWRTHNPEADSGLLPSGNDSAKQDVAPRCEPLPPYTLEEESGVWVVHWADAYEPTSLDMPIGSTRQMAEGELGRVWANGSLRLSEAEPAGGVQMPCEGHEPSTDDQPISGEGCLDGVVEKALAVNLELARTQDFI